MMNSVIDRLAEVLSAVPTPVLDSTRLGAKKPSSASEVPAIVISLTLEGGVVNDIGRFIGSKSITAPHTAVIQVGITPDAFSSDLRVLRIQPLPLKRNPASSGGPLTEEDVKVRNVTDEPVDYQIVDEPGEKSEYRVDFHRAEIVFGETQTEGDKLEVIHWTTDWGDEVLGETYKGSIILEVWANGFSEADALSRQTQGRLKSDRALLRQKGFLKLQPASLEPVENVLHETTSGTAFPVWRQKLGYKFAFEAQESGASVGVPIKRIDIDMDEDIVESFSVPS